MAHERHQAGCVLEGRGNQVMCACVNSKLTMNHGVEQPAEKLAQITDG